MYIEYSLIIHHSLSLTTDLCTVNLIALNRTQFCVLFLWYIEQSGALSSDVPPPNKFLEETFKESSHVNMLPVAELLKE